MKIGPYELDTIVQGDCLELMKAIPDKSIDLILTDPPYGISVGGAKPFGDKRISVGGANIVEPKEYPWFDDSTPLTDKQFKEICRISKNQIIFGGNYFNVPPSPCWIVWDKDRTGNFADCELAWTSFKTAVRKVKWRWNGMFQEKQHRKEERFHPTQKPIDVFRWILKTYAKADDVILDPFLGSGTTALACKQMGIKWLGFEISQAYVDIAKNRLRQEVLSCIN